MKLSELPGIAASKPKEGSAPNWLLGTFSRRSITFHTGAEDSQTRVLWLQSLGLSADFRFPPDRIRRQGRNSLDEFTREELLSLAANEGGLSRTSWSGSTMTWFDWAAFQTHAKWAEPGELRRIGDCVVEFAPSGAYVEDWRFQPSSPGLLIGLRLVSESDLKTGEVLYRDGGLIICGDHAAFVRGRALDLPPGKLTETVAHMSREEMIATIVSFDASYATRAGTDDPFIVSLSTNPLREGEALIAEDGFTYEDGRIYQRTHDVQREFTIDTLEACVEFSPATESTLEGMAWLRRESDTLLTHTQPVSVRSRG